MRENSMDYELAKKLKDAGFPQKGRSDRWATNSTNPECQKYIPTLFELIEACGDRFRSIEYISEPFTSWQASCFTKKCKCCGATGKRITKYSQTPETSVALVWLELQEN